jgi:hypothetical protein
MADREQNMMTDSPATNNPGEGNTAFPSKLGVSPVPTLDLTPKTTDGFYPKSTPPSYVPPVGDNRGRDRR